MLETPDDQQPIQSQVLPPTREEPSKNWEHFELWKRIFVLFENLPKQFESIITVSGIAATEVYTFGAVLGATIEEEVVRTLNILRSEWDPEDKYNNYLFVRQPQTFPDIVLKGA